MEKKYLVVFDEIAKERLEKVIAQSEYREIIKNWFDELEQNGPTAGKLLDNHVWLYEMKNKRPPLRLYFYHQKSTHKIILFEVEMKTSEKKQQETIGKLRHKLSKFLNLFVYTLFSLRFRGIPAGAYRVWYYAGFLLHTLRPYSPALTP